MKNIMLCLLFFACFGWHGYSYTADSVRAPECPEYIEFGRWIYRFNEWTLELKPTACGRLIGVDETAYMFYEIAKKFSGDEYWKNTRGLINQLTCHLQIARNKAEWNLDPWRPYVGHNALVGLGCNAVDPKPSLPFE